MSDEFVFDGQNESTVGLTDDMKPDLDRLNRLYLEAFGVQWVADRCEVRTYSDNSPVTLAIDGETAKFIAAVHNAFPELLAYAQHRDSLQADLAAALARAEKAEGEAKELRTVFYVVYDALNQVNQHFRIVEKAYPQAIAFEDMVIALEQTKDFWQRIEPEFKIPSED